MMRIDCGWVHRSRFFLVVVIALTAGAPRVEAQTGCAGVANDPKGGITWVPKFCQEFNDPAPRSPDPAVWTYDLGGGGWGNRELEIYCGPAGSPSNPVGCPSEALTSGTVYLDGRGHLVLRAIDVGGTWYSARLKTLGLHSFQYGRMEASMELPDTTGPGLWPSIWSMGTNIGTVGWPNCGEADIMEVWPQLRGGPGTTGNRATLHTQRTRGPGLQPNGRFTFPPAKVQANSAAFHTYGLIWSANMQQYYVDDLLHPYYIATRSDISSDDVWPFNGPFFLLTNIAVGGYLGGTPGPSTPNPAIMMIDYVRQYTVLQPVPAPVLGTPAPIAVIAGASTGNTSTFTPKLAFGTGFNYFSCSTTAPQASCAISTTDPLNASVVSSTASPPETVTATIFTTANGAKQANDGGAKNGTTVAASLIGGTPPGNYTTTVYAFTESNTSDGANAKADASVSIPLTVN
jgi:hypothetical protein